MEIGKGWYQNVPLGDGKMSGGEQDCFPRWKAMDLPNNLEGKRVLDIGASEGFFSMECADRGAEVFAVELDTGKQKRFCFVRKARGHSFRNVKLIKKDVVEYLLHCEDNYFDIIFSLSVIHHLRGPFQHLWDISRVLKSDGVFFLELPKKLSPPIKFRKGRSFYLGKDVVEMVLSRWFKSYSLILDWRNSVGNERLVYRAIGK